MNVQSSLSKQMDQAAQGQSPVIHVITGVPGSGKSYAAALSADKGVIAEPVTVTGTYNDLMKVMLTTASTPNRLIVVDADTAEDAVSSIAYARELGSKKVNVEAMFAPLNVCLKRLDVKSGVEAEKTIEERIAALRMLGSAAGAADGFVLSCNSWQGDTKTIPTKVVIAEKGNVQFAHGVRVAHIKEQIRQEGVYLMEYLKKWDVPQARIVQLAGAHHEAAAQAGNFLQTILERGKIKSAPHAGL